MARDIKNSGIEWIGDIPADWDIIKIKYIFNIIGGNGFPDELQGKNNGDFPFCKVSDINGNSMFISTANNYVSADIVKKHKFNIIPENSIILAKIGAALQKNHRKINTVACCIDNNTQALVPKRNDNVGYLYFLSKCIDMGWFDNKGTVPSINNTKLLNFFVPNIDVNKQTEIALFLQKTCDEIDTIISNTKSAIEEYKKLKQSVITEAVTKGIRGDRPMKDSGIEWIGEFPSEWTFAELKMFCKVNNGKEIANEVDKETEGAISVYGSGGVFKYTNNYMFDGTTVMFGRKGTLGKPLYVTGKVWVVDTMYYLTYSTNLIPKFNYYQLWAFDWIPHITQTALPSIVASQIVACKFAVPSLQEQQEIIDFLDSKCSEIDKLIADKTHLLEEMESYKKSVIYEYVTGKKEVI